MTFATYIVYSLWEVNWICKVVLFSHSGTTPELIPLPPMFQRLGCDVMTIIGDEKSPLGFQSNYVSFFHFKITVVVFLMSPLLWTIGAFSRSNR
jgi:fructoselysine-6-P-deglycase FrlB-like protein